MEDEKIEQISEGLGAHPLLRLCHKHGGECGSIAVVFECCGCCKRATKVKIAEVACGLIVLTGVDCGYLHVKTCCCCKCKDDGKGKDEAKGKDGDKQRVKVLIIPIEKLCCIEIGPKEEDCHEHSE